MFPQSFVHVLRSSESARRGDLFHDHSVRTWTGPGDGDRLIRGSASRPNRRRLRSTGGPRAGGPGVRLEVWSEVGHGPGRQHA